MANKPNNPSLWSKAKSLAKSKFDVYPSAYSNAFAAKWYKSKGGTWRKGEKGMMMQDGGTITDIPVKRMKTKTVAVSPSGYYKTIKKQKLTPRGESSSSTVRRTARGLLKGAPRATNIMPNPGEINNMPNPKEIESPYLKTSMKNGGMTPANKAAMKLAKNMKGKVIGSDRMLKHGGFHSKPKMQQGGQDRTYTYQDETKPPASFREKVFRGDYDKERKSFLNPQVTKMSERGTAKNIMTSGDASRRERVRVASEYTGIPRKEIRNQNPTAVGKVLRSMAPGKVVKSISNQSPFWGASRCTGGGCLDPKTGTTYKKGGSKSKLKQAYLNKYK